MIYNFNVDVFPDAAGKASKKKISIRPFNVIYRFLEDVKAELNSRVPPSKVEEEVTGELADGRVECLFVCGYIMYTYRTNLLHLVQPKLPFLNSSC